MTARDWRAGELTLLVLALVLAVAALTSVGFLADRLRQGLERDARQMLGADFVVRADHPVDPSFARDAHALGLRTATTAIFPSMIAAAAAPRPGDAAPARLAAVKAVSAGYPLRGAVEIVPAGASAARQTTDIPRPAPCGPIRRCSTRCI
jgi:putative ABC transport system permease protein